MIKNREQEIIDILKNEYLKNRKDNITVSEHTTSAIITTKNWQNQISNVEVEVPVNSKINEKIDLIDFINKTAYEYKFSGKNISHEFYKDLIKVLLFNKYQKNERKLKKFIFISENEAINEFKKKEFFKAIQEEFSSIEIELYGI